MQWDYATHNYEDKLLFSINPTACLDPKLKASFLDVTDQVNNQAEYDEE